MKPYEVGDLNPGAAGVIATLTDCRLLTEPASVGRGGRPANMVNPRSRLGEM